MILQFEGARVQLIEPEGVEMLSSSLQRETGANTLAWPALTSGLLPPRALPSKFSHHSKSKLKKFPLWSCMSERLGRLPISRPTETWQV